MTKHPVESGQEDDVGELFPRGLRDGVYKLGSWLVARIAPIALLVIGALVILGPDRAADVINLLS